MECPLPVSRLGSAHPCLAHPTPIPQMHKRTSIWLWQQKRIKSDIYICLHVIVCSSDANATINSLHAETRKQHWMQTLRRGGVYGVVHPSKATERFPKIWEILRVKGNVEVGGDALLSKNQANPAWSWDSFSWRTKSKGTTSSLKGGLNKSWLEAMYRHSLIIVPLIGMYWKICTSL